MANKDYYAILQVKPGANLPEIKKSYRRLALQFHPDKNPENPMAKEKFQELTEAYNVLGDARKREQYHYARWWKGTVGKRQNHPPISPYAILLQCREISNRVKQSNSFRINRDSLFFQLMAIISDERIALLNDWGDGFTNFQIVKEADTASTPLAFQQWKLINLQLRKIDPSNATQQAFLIQRARETRGLHLWEKYKFLAAVLLTLLLCLLMYALG